jgi:hypothetical protein
MWLVMNLGHRPFALDDRGKLTLSFAPLLPSWLFTDKAHDGFPARTYSFKLFAQIMVIYHNPKLKDTFGPRGVKARKIMLTYTDGKQVEIAGGHLDGSYALDVREGAVSRIDVFLN